MVEFADTGVAVEFVVVGDRVEMIVEHRALVHSLRAVVGDMPDSVAEELIEVLQLPEELASAAYLQVVEVAFQNLEVQTDVHQTVAGVKKGPYSYLQVVVLTCLVAIQLDWAANDLHLLEHLGDGLRKIVVVKKDPCSYLPVAAVAVQASLVAIQLDWVANDLQLLEHAEVGVDLGYDLKKGASYLAWTKV